MPSISPVSRPHRLRLFAAEYVKNGFQAQKAVLSAGFTQNPGSAAVIAHRLLNDVNCDAIIEEHMQDAKMSADEVLERLTKVARTETEFKGSDVVKAAELLGKGHKLFVDKIESSITTTDSSSVKLALTRRISKIATKTGESEKSVEYQLQTELSDRSDEDYSAELDASVHPEMWPSGNLLSSQQVAAITEIGDQ